MADKYDLPVLVREIPTQNATIGSPFRLDAKEYIQHPLGPGEELLFSGYGENNFPLPRDFHCTADGIFEGIPAKGSFRPQGYIITLRAETSVGRALLVSFHLIISKSIRLDDAEHLEEAGHDSEFSADSDFDGAIDVNLEEIESIEKRVEDQILDAAEMDRDKQKVWQAILEEKSIPEIQSIFDREITYEEIYHLISRFAYFAIWNADNPDNPGEKQRLLLEGASEHFDVYDRGSCIVSAPKQLFDHARTLQHGIDTAKAMAREVLSRGWKVEFGGYDKMVRAAWVEMEAHAELQNKETAYAHFFPTDQDFQLLDQARQKLQL